MNAPITAFFDIHHGLQRGRRRRQNNGNIFDLRPRHRHIAGMIDNAFFLFESGFMFFINHDQAQIFKRQEQRRTCAQDQPAFTGRDLVPCPPLFRLGDIGVPQDGSHPETRRKTCQKLYTKGDFRQQHHRLLAFAQTGGNRLAKHLRLARSRHPIKQCHRKRLAIHLLA